MNSEKLMSKANIFWKLCCYFYADRKKMIVL